MEAAKQNTILAAPAGPLVKAIAAQLKRDNQLEVPAWVDVVKTGAFKSFVPSDVDWFYVRAAAVARQLSLRNTGVHALQKHFGGRQRNGSAPPHRALSSGAVNRKAVQALEKLGWAAKVDKKGGRVLTAAGRRALSDIAEAVIKAQRE